MSTPRQYPVWGKRGVWGKVTMISRGVEISIAGGGGEMVRVLSLSRFFFFFVIMRSLFFRYKKPHAALAMERTKPINPNKITKESYGTNKYPLSRRFLLRRASGHL